MPLKFKVRNGPWKQLFSGVWEGSESELYENPDSVFLTLAFEKKGKDVTAVAIEFYQAYFAEGELETLVDRLPRECLLLEKREKSSTKKFLLVESGAGYSKWKEELFMKETDELIERMEDSKKLILELSSTYSISLTPLNKAGENAKNAFLSQSIIMPLLSRGASATSDTTASNRGELEAMYIPNRPSSERKGAGIVLGKTKEGTIVEEPISLFKGTLVSNGTERERNHAMQLLIESFLITDANAFVLDWSNRFAGLSHPTLQRESLKQMAPTLDPIGFPTQNYLVPRDLHINLNQLTPETVSEAIGLGNSEASQVIPEALKIEATQLTDWIGQLKRTMETDKASLFQTMRCIRAIRLVSMQLPNDWFGGKNNLQPLVAPSTTSVGKANLIALNPLQEKASALFVQSISKELLLWIQTQPNNGIVRATIAIPEIQKSTGLDHRLELGKGIALAAKSLQQQNVAVLLSAEQENAIAKELLSSVPMHVEIVNANDVSITPQDGKSYRVQLHPGMSERSSK